MAPNEPAVYEVSRTTKLTDKMKQAPFIPIGVAGMIGALGWGAYTFKNRGEMSPSVFLMHLRVKAQGMVVGAITVGVAYTLFRDYMWNKPEHGHHKHKDNQKHH